MYYHLFDADWASNALSWQWVCAAFSSKKYFANQENINKFCNTKQRGTILDHSYEELELLDLTDEFSELVDLKLKTNLPVINDFKVDENLPTYIYNFYNLDCNWDADVSANRVLLLEPSFFNQFPVSDKTIEFVLQLSKNINDIQVFVGEFSELKNKLHHSSVHYKEHPTSKHYEGKRHEREWMFENNSDYFSSFFSFWKKSSKNCSLFSQNAC